MGDSCCWCCGGGGGARLEVAWQRLQQLQGARSHADGTSHKVNVHLVPLQGNKLPHQEKKMNSFKFRTQPIMLEVRCRLRLCV